jgi:hypothetical protein
MKWFKKKKEDIKLSQEEIDEMEYNRFSIFMDSLISTEIDFEFRIDGFGFVNINFKIIDDEIDDNLCEVNIPLKNRYDNFIFNEFLSFRINKNYLKYLDMYIAEFKNKNK